MFNVIISQIGFFYEVSCINTLALFYLTIRIIRHTNRFAWRQAAQRSSPNRRCS